MTTQGEQAGTESMLQDGDEHGEDMSKTGTENPQHTQEEEPVPEDDNESPYANDISSLCTDLVRRRAEAEAARTRIQYAVKEIELRK